MKDTENRTRTITSKGDEDGESWYCVIIPQELTALQLVFRVLRRGPIKAIVALPPPCIIIPIPHIRYPQHLGLQLGGRQLQRQEHDSSGQVH